MIMALDAHRDYCRLAIVNFSIAHQARLSSLAALAWFQIR